MLIRCKMLLISVVYISDMYCGQLWFNSTKYCLNEPHVSYNNRCRRLLILPMRNSASEMFVHCNMLSFGELLNKLIFAFESQMLLLCTHPANIRTVANNLTFRLYGSRVSR